MARGERMGERSAWIELFATIRHAQSQAIARAKLHHQSSRQERMQRRSNELLAEFGVTSGAAPAWATRHLQDIASECATRMVDSKLSARLYLIDRASFRMSLTRKVRETRSKNREIGLGG